MEYREESYGGALTPNADLKVSLGIALIKVCPLNL